MIPVVIFASVFANNESSCLQRVYDLTQTMPASCKCILLDENFQQKNICTTTKTVAITHINLSDWIDSMQQPLKVKIRSQADGLSANQIILLDTRHHDASIVSMLLHEISKIWFYLKVWQPAFVLIADDFHALRFARELSETFYIQPLSTSQHVIQTQAHSMRKHIISYRWLGLGRMSRTAQLLHNFLQKLKRHVRHKIS